MFSHIQREKGREKVKKKGKKGTAWYSGISNGDRFPFISLWMITKSYEALPGQDIENQTWGLTFVFSFLRRENSTHPIPILYLCM